MATRPKGLPFAPLSVSRSVADSLVAENPLWDAIRAAHERWSPSTLERFPPLTEWEPSQADVGTAIDIFNQIDRPSVPTVPTVPTLKQGDWGWEAQPTVEELAIWEERAAILEFDGGLDRETAERLAALTASS